MFEWINHKQSKKKGGWCLGLKPLLTSESHDAVLGACQLSE